MSADSVARRTRRERMRARAEEPTRATAHGWSWISTLGVLGTGAYAATAISMTGGEGGIGALGDGLSVIAWGLAGGCAAGAVLAASVDKVFGGVLVGLGVLGVPIALLLGCGDDAAGATGAGTTGDATSTGSTSLPDDGTTSSTSGGGG